jgi:hypothetical protein
MIAILISRARLRFAIAAIRLGRRIVHAEMQRWGVHP